MWGRNRRGVLGLAQLALVGLFLRALLPAGWMPSADALLIVCSLDGLTTVAIGADGKPVDPEHAPPSDHAPCAFSSAAPAAPAPEAAGLTVPGVGTAIYVPVSRPIAVALATLRLPPARAPPAV